ncbi:hypothetical protein BLNAU_9719 [Blattamonas nauphoetae]|uniref:Uncharacterized protein n=1 Tax=Blattamonas nauphoetae TaxID=2049346 RepID=A0ABQ9XV20_9EUKA|nr:hypothetical protein BLNAU_9719 [Blattamonas nauphoetae]
MPSLARGETEPRSKKSRVVIWRRPVHSQLQERGTAEAVESDESLSDSKRSSQSSMSGLFFPYIDRTEKSVRSVLNPARAQFSVEVPFCSTVTPSCEPARILLLAA